jgi:hypothetical protein
MPKARRRGRNYKVLLGSFVFFAALLFGASLALPYLTGLRTEHIPVSASIAMQPWMDLVPSTADTVDFTNVSWAIAEGLNTTKGSTLLNIYQTSQILSLVNTTYLLSYGIPNPNPQNNETGVDVFKAHDDTYASLLDTINYSSIVGRQLYRGVTIYFVNNNVTVGDLETGRIAFYNGYIFYSQGTADPTAQVKAGLDVALNQTTSLFTNRTVQLSVYAVAGNRTDYMALHYIGFGAQIGGSNCAAKAVSGTSTDLQALYAFGFNTSSTASSKADLVTSTYQHALDYYLLDNYVVAKVPVYQEELFIMVMGF